jgi:hypothetical protein
MRMRATKMPSEPPSARGCARIDASSAGERSLRTAITTFTSSREAASTSSANAGRVGARPTRRLAEGEPVRPGELGCGDMGEREHPGQSGPRLG